MDVLRLQQQQYKKTANSDELKAFKRTGLNGDSLLMADFQKN